MRIDVPAAPQRHEWERFGVSDVVELQSGRQSRVFRARLDGNDVAVKLTDRRLADGARMTTRLTVVEALAEDVVEVVAPHRIDGRLVQTIGGWLMSATSMVHGDHLDLARDGAGERMGRALAQLHVAMASVPPQHLPAVAALDTVGDETDRVGWQLLHGDFNEHNVVETVGGLRVIDFDDCGYGPVLFDVANTLYMVLFDAEITGDPQRSAAVRPALLGGYAAASGSAIDISAIDHYIALRIDALGRWLEDLATAPIGIRTASTQWQETLRGFVRTHRT